MQVKICNPENGASIGASRPFSINNVPYVLPVGTCVVMPEDHALYLRKIYGFLQVYQGEAVSSEEKQENDLAVKCPDCDKEMKPRALPMHQGRFHK